MNNLKILRDERGLSMRGMEIKTGIKYNTYSRYETGERDMSTEVLKKLADFFEVSIDYLLCYNGFCLFVTYENGKCMYKLNKSFYDYLNSEGYIYFNDHDNRCIDLNKLFGLDSTSDVSMVINEYVRIKNFDKLFDKKKATLEEFENIANDSSEVVLDMKLISEVMDIITNI